MTDHRQQRNHGEIRPLTSVLCPPKSICFIFCPSPAWWLLRSDKTRSHPELGRQTLQRRWYYVSRPGRVGRCQACQGQKNSSSTGRRTTEDGRQISVFRPLSSVLRPLFIAGWSSPVARQAHNLKVTGSNPVPATKFKPAAALISPPLAGFFVCAVVALIRRGEFAVANEARRAKIQSSTSEARK
jgi:hypothetical protein